MEDITLYDESMPVYDRRDDILEEDEEEEETIDESYLNYISEDANYSEENCYPVFIVLTHSGTAMANIIQKFTKDEYSHAAISFNSALDPMYTFGNKNATTLKGDAGFVIQNPKSEFYSNYNVKYAIYVMYVTQQQYIAMQKALNMFIAKKDEWKYDLVNLVSIWLNRPSEKSKKYFCSRFVAEIINAGYRLDKVPSLYKPQELKGLNNITLVNKGNDLRYYDSMITDANLEYIKSHDFKSVSVHEDCFEANIDIGIVTIIFDFGGVLVKNRVDTDDIMKKLNLTEDELRSAMILYYNTVYENDNYSYNKALNIYTNSLTNEFKKYAKELFDFAVGSKELYIYTIPVLKGLKAKGYKLYYLSNWTRSSYEICKKNGLFDFLKYFDGGMFSFQEGLQKPDLKFFTKLLNKYSLNPKECLFVDDQTINIEAAKKLGLNTHLFNAKTSVLSVEESSINYDDSYEVLPTKSEVVFDLPEVPVGSDIRTILDNTDPKHIYFTSDWHISKNHYKHEANYVNTVKIAKWCRDNIKDNDVFFYLGDIAFRYADEEDQKKSQEIMSKIPGIKVFILGNHDKMLGQEYFTACGFDYVFEELEWKDYIFTHQPINMDTKPSNMLNIHGHIHNMETYNTTDGKRNVNVYPMWFDNKPVTLDYIINHIDELTKNHSWNWNAGYSEVTVDFSEAMILPQKDLIYHKNEFDSGEINLAFIVGFSGSGKTVMARQLADKYDNCDYIELDDVLSIGHFSDDNLKEYSSLLYDFFTGPGKKYRVMYQYAVDNHISENEYAKPLVKDIIDYAISYAKSHKDKRFILEGIWPLVYGINPSKFKDCMVCIKGTPYLASTIRAFNRDTKDKPFFKKISYSAQFLKHFKDMGLDLNKGIKEYTQYFKSHAGKDELVSESLLDSRESSGTTFYRVSYDGIGIYEAYKNAVTPTKWHEFINSQNAKWLPKPSVKNYKDSYASYFTETGYNTFSTKVLPLFMVALDSKKINIEKTKDINLRYKVVYEDTMQIVIDLSKKLSSYNEDSDDYYYYKYLDASTANPHNSIDESSISEANLIFNTDNIEYNCDTLAPNTSNNILFITGYSGAGKSTLMANLNEKYGNNIMTVAGDVFFFVCRHKYRVDNGIAVNDNQIAQYGFTNVTSRNFIGPVLARYFDFYYDEIKLSNDLFSNKELFSYWVHFVKWLYKDTAVNKVFYRNKIIVVEGIQISNTDPELYKGHALIIVGTSALVSWYRKAKRDIIIPSKYDWKHIKTLFTMIPVYANDYKRLNNLEKLNESKRSELPDSSFGIPEDRKYPLDTEQHVKSAIKLFGHAEESKKKSLAKRIRAAAKRYDISIPETTQCYKYLNEAMADIIPNDVTNVIFDLGSVLVDYDYEASLKMNPDIPNEYVSDIKDAIYNYLFFPLDPDDERHIQMLGVNQAIERFERLAPEHIKPYAKEAIESFRFNTVFNYDYTDQLIEKCKQQGYNIYYLSNWAKYTYILQKSYFDVLLPKFNGGIMSYEVDMLKPDPEIYIALCDKYNLDPSKCIFFDDKAANVEGAKRIGMQAYVFDHKTTPQKLLNEGINIPENADDYLLIQTSRGLRNLPINKINQWYASDSRETPSINIDQYSVTANDAIHQAINKLTDAKAFDKEIYIPLYVFANSLFFTGNESNNVPICIGQVNTFPTNDFEWVIQYPLKINGEAIESVKEYSMANTNPVIGIGRSFMINTGEKLAYAQDIEPEKCLVVNDDGILEVQPTDGMQISEVYEFTGNKAYVNRLNKLYKESAKVDNIYSILTSKPLLSNDQILFDESFCKIDFDLLEQKALAEFATLKEQIIAACGMKGLNGFVLESAVHNINPPFMSKYNKLGDILIKEDFDGVYFYSKLTNKRSASVKSPSMLTENMLIAIL